MEYNPFKIAAGNWQNVQMTFVAPADYDDAVLTFGDLGIDAPRTVWFKNISLKPGGKDGLTAEETLEKQSVPTMPRNASRAWTLPALADWMHFLSDTETNYWTSMESFVKGELGFKGVYIGTIVGDSTPYIQSSVDAIDSHDYWHHPEWLGRGAWGATPWMVRNESMVNGMLNSGSPVELATHTVAGKPHFVTEYNNPAPNTYSGEGPLLLATEAAFQDWDGFFWFDYDMPKNNTPEGSGYFGGFFEISQHPTKMVNLLLAAQIFRRGDVAPARQRLHLTADPADEPLRLGLTRKGWSLPDWKEVLRDAMVHGIDFTFTATAMPRPQTPPADTTNFISDTGQITWNIEKPDKGYVQINAPRTRAVIGFADGRAFTLGDITITPGKTQQDWSTIALTLSDGQSFASTCKGLIVATGYTENTGMQWKGDHHESVSNWGRFPSLIEVVPADIELPADPAKVHVYALDSKGQRGDPIPVTDHDGHALIHIGPPAATLWYELDVD